MLKSVVAVTAGLVAVADAFWRMECQGRVGLARMDPIVYPGEDSPHLHAIHGSSAFSETSGTSELLAGNCTSCRVTQDKSAYWHPALYFQDAITKQFELVPQVGGMLAYYLLYGDNIKAFPTDFRMVSGDTARRTYTAGDPTQPDPAKSLWASLGQTTQEILAQRAVGFNCLNYDKAPEGTLYRHFMPDKAFLDANCKDGIRFEIMFPSCWKGGDATDSPNHQDHVAFPDLVMTGNCPEGFPERLPSMLFEVIWNTNAYAGRDGHFVISNGDVTGYGLHADFIMGWDEDFLQQAVNQCTSDTGLIEACPLFNIVDQATAMQCHLEDMPAHLLKEDGNGPFNELPGGLQVGGSGHGHGHGKPSGSPTKGPAPTLPYQPGVTAPVKGSPLPGQVFKEAATEKASGVQIAAVESPKPAVTPAPAGAAGNAPVPFISTQFITVGDVVSEIVWKQEVVTVTEEPKPSTTVTVTATGARPAKHRRSAHGHGHGHGHGHAQGQGQL
ncbi:glyoxal oxidase precursor [Trichoderma arundinaceum]|uniref:Glyoxal oxidase n=1 Tax=Trichoderma arundinaceum TaxID=490622 RepID=A0A395NYR3_TRIAR|nr:glyoxal oxidase precursor [Trichoderma arundinaceum]